MMKKYYVFYLLIAALILCGCGTTKGTPTTKGTVLFADTDDDIPTKGTVLFADTDKDNSAKRTVPFVDEDNSAKRTVPFVKVPFVRDSWAELLGNLEPVVEERDLSELENLYEKECASKDEITLIFTGDIGQSEGMPITSKLDAEGGDISKCLTNGLTDVLINADILTVNNEFTYSTRGTPVEGKAYTFRANPSRVHILTDIGADVASLANNHAFDYTEDALYDTMNTLKDAGICYIGAGKDIEEASLPAYFLANDKLIAICAATQVERSNNQTQYATEDRCGVNKCLDDTLFCEEIKKASEIADYVIVYVHWGTEGSAYFESDQIELAEDFVKAGADAIIGAHPHNLQGISYINDIPVCYSLGNFWFNSMERDTGLIRLIIKDDEIKMQFIPCYANNCTTKLVTDESEKSRIINYMESISYGVTIDEEGFVSKE
ncbi:MAG: CapA family protein [Eubacterium sp.]|nr:CapA family protein [Eubacterium sp.]